MNKLSKTVRACQPDCDPCPGSRFDVEFDPISFIGLIGLMEAQSALDLTSGDYVFASDFRYHFTSDIVPILV